MRSHLTLVEHPGENAALNELLTSVPVASSQLLYLPSVDKQKPPKRRGLLSVSCLLIPEKGAKTEKQIS